MCVSSSKQGEEWRDVSHNPVDRTMILSDDGPHPVISVLSELNNAKCQRFVRVQKNAANEWTGFFKKKKKKKLEQGKQQ